MDNGAVVCALAALCGFGCAFLLCARLLDWLLARRTADVLARRAGSGSALARLVRNGVGPLCPLAARLLGQGGVARLCANACAAVSDWGLQSTPVALCSLLLTAVAALLVLGWFGGAPLLGVVASLGLCAALSAAAAYAADSRNESMRQGLPDALRAMGVCFHAGYSVQQTFAQLVKETAGPLQMAFGRASQALQAGASLPEALDQLRGGGEVAELSFVSVALAVQHQSGGSMQHVLDATIDSLSSELDLRRSLRVHTAQARMSARAVTGVTIALVGALAALSPHFLDPFFQSPLGAAMLACAIAMQLAGVFVVRRMLKVEVD